MRNVTLPVSIVLYFILSIRHCARVKYFKCRPKLSPLMEHYKTILEDRVQKQHFKKVLRQKLYIGTRSPYK